MRLAFLLLALAALALLPTAAEATGYRTVDGYRLYDTSPYYWYGNYAHTRVAYTTPGYYSYGYYYPGTTSYRYVYSHTYYPQTAAATITYQTPNAQSALIQLKRDLIAQQNFNDSVKVLGLQGHPSIGNPLYSTYGGYSGSLTLSTAGTQGSTVYGYNGAQQPAPNLDLNVLFQQATRLAENTQKLTGQATGDLTAAVAQAAAGQARVAEIEAKGRALALIQHSLNGTVTTKSSANLQFKSEPPAPPPNGGPKEDQPPPPMPAAEKEFPAKAQAQGGWAASAQKCVACHGAALAEGGFRVTDYATMSRDQKLAVIGRLLSPVEAKRMPRDASGGPGPKLDGAEIVEWLNR